MFNFSSILASIISGGMPPDPLVPTIGDSKGGPGGAVAPPAKIL